MAEIADTCDVLVSVNSVRHLTHSLTQLILLKSAKESDIYLSFFILQQHNGQSLAFSLLNPIDLCRSNDIAMTAAGHSQEAAFINCIGYPTARSMATAMPI